jgi:hypothetical protein
MDYDPRYQDGPNGPLKKEVRDRINAFRPDSTLAQIGEAFGFSGPFISQLLNPKNPARVRTLHVPRMMKALEKAEAERNTGQTSLIAAAGSSAQMSLEDHIRAIDALGFTVTVTPKQR